MQEPGFLYLSRTAGLTDLQTQTATTHTVLMHGGSGAPRIQRDICPEKLDYPDKRDI